MQSQRDPLHQTTVTVLHKPGWDEDRPEANLTVYQSRLTVPELLTMYDEFQDHPDGMSIWPEYLDEYYRANFER